jgi:hypothetical protein
MAGILQPVIVCAPNWKRVLQADASKTAGGAPVSTAMVLADAKIKAQRIANELLGAQAPTII